MKFPLFPKRKSKFVTTGIGGVPDELDEDVLLLDEETPEEVLLLDEEKPPEEDVLLLDEEKPEEEVLLLDEEKPEEDVLLLDEDEFEFFKVLKDFAISSSLLQDDIVHINTKDNIISYANLLGNIII